LRQTYPQKRAETKMTPKKYYDREGLCRLKPARVTVTIANLLLEMILSERMVIRAVSLLLLR